MNEDFINALTEEAKKLNPTHDCIDVSVSPSGQVITIKGVDVEPPGVAGDPRNGPSFYETFLGELRWFNHTTSEPMLRLFAIRNKKDGSWHDFEIGDWIDFFTLNCLTKYNQHTSWQYRDDVEIVEFSCYPTKETK